MASGSHLMSEERRRSILDLVSRDGRVLVKSLASDFRISEVTIRQDLEMLHQRGLVQRIHGGALLLRTALLDPSLREKEKVNRKEKQRIAEAAARQVKEGQSVMLGSGSTTTAVARALREFKQLTIITNALNIGAELAGTAIEVVLTGGILRENSFSLVGPLAEEMLLRLGADVLFLGADGVDFHRGSFTPNAFEASIQRVMMKIARRTIIVCDSSKFGSRSLSLVAPIAEIRELITDKRASKTDLHGFEKAGVKVMLV
ncbi:MAG: DeoR/GlpR transcriptional regulator [Acidobacteriota bacterium]|nr:DeoR/GlpR transcriptional regulator [Acidobacteriota bacterium]